MSLFHFRCVTSVSNCFFCFYFPVLTIIIIYVFSVVVLNRLCDFNIFFVVVVVVVCYKSIIWRMMVMIRAARLCVN